MACTSRHELRERKLGLGPEYAPKEMKLAKKGSAQQVTT